MARTYPTVLLLGRFAQCRFQAAPVDTNLFPGGFNNLSPEMLPLAVQAAMAAIEKYCPDAKNLLLVPEGHTRNTFYLQNVARLMQIFRQTGLNVRLGSLSPDVTAPTPIELPDGTTLTLEPLERSQNGRRVGLKNFDPCTCLLYTSPSPRDQRGSRMPSSA